MEIQASTRPDTILGSSITADDEGQLVVVGAGSATNVIGDQTWRFLPGGLNYPPIYFACCNTNPTVRGAAWRPASPTSVARFGPTAITMCRGDIISALPPAIPGGSVWAFGGSTLMTASDGIEFFQGLTPRSTPVVGSIWRHTIVPNPAIVTPPHTAPVPNESYDPQNGLTEVQMDSNPRALQLATATGGQQTFEKPVFVAADSNTVYPPNTYSASNTGGRTYVVRPHYSTAQAAWELWAGGTSVDRCRGTAVLRHDLTGIYGHTGKNRVFGIGGMHYVSGGPTPGWVTSTGVSEYRAGNDPTSGTWSSEVPPAGQPNPGAVDNCVVILPTGDLFVQGGAQTVDPATGDPVLPLVHTPILFRPAIAGALSGWSSSAMATPPPAPLSSPPTPFARLRDSIAVLLPDGRVFTAFGSVTPQGYVDGRFTGAAFSPPYLHQVFRPSIASISTTNLNFVQPFTMDVLRGGDTVIDRVVLLRPASLADNFDTSQRYIELSFITIYSDPSMESLQVTAPSEDLAPPGFYMLFVVTHLVTDPTNRVPSVGMMVRLPL